MTKFNKGDIARIPGYGLCVVKSGPYQDGPLKAYYKVWLLEYRRTMEVYSKSVYPVKAEVESD